MAAFALIWSLEFRRLLFRSDAADHRIRHRLIGRGGSGAAPPPLPPRPMRRCLMRRSAASGRLVVVSEPNGQAPLYVHRTDRKSVEQGKSDAARTNHTTHNKN